jgi:hypothetical protein
MAEPPLWGTEDQDASVWVIHEENMKLKVRIRWIQDLQVEALLDLLVLEAR